MAYKNRNSFIKNISSIGKWSGSPGLTGSSSFVPSDYGYGGSDIYSGRYCKYGTSCLGGKWGAERYDTDYSYKGSPIPFAKAYLCPIPARHNELPQYLGNKQIYVDATASPRTTTTYYVRYESSNHYLYGGTSSNPTSRIGYGPLIVVDLQAAGGGAGATAHMYDYAGSGGGGGGFISVVLDLRITGQIAITVGAGGFSGEKSGTDSSSKDNIGLGWDGDDSTIKYGNVVILAQGGRAGRTCTLNFNGSASLAGDGGAGGTVKITNNGTDVTNNNLTGIGILSKQYYYGKSGGKSQGLPGTSDPYKSAPMGPEFVDTDELTGHGIVDSVSIRSRVYWGGDTTYYSYSSSYEVSAAGGSAGSAVFGGGSRRANNEDYLTYGGGGGAGGRISANWGGFLGLVKTIYKIEGSQGQNGVAVLSYATSL